MKIDTHIPAMSSVLNDTDKYRHVCNHTKAGQRPYAIVILLFLVEMIQMKKLEPDNWTKLAKKHVIRHSYSHWTGIVSVLIVEQVLSQKYSWPLP